MQGGSCLLLSMILVTTRTITSFTKNVYSSYPKRVAKITFDGRSNAAFMSATDDRVHVSKEAMSALAQRVKEVNDLNGMENIQKADFIPFNFGRMTYGYLSRDFANLLGNYTDTFQFNENAGTAVIQLASSICEMNLIDRSAAVGKVTADLKAQKIITGLHNHSHQQFDAAFSNLFV